MRRITLLIGLATAFIASSVNAQVRTASQPADPCGGENSQCMEVDLLFDILTVVVNRLNVDDPEVLAQGNDEIFGDIRTFADFDVDRNGMVMAIQAARGIFDLNLAIQQFVHDKVDADEDGIIGFYELECKYAAAGINLDPSSGETQEGVPDGQVDCDGDGAANLVEINAGTNPLDPNDFPEPDFEVIDPGLGTQPLAASSPEGERTLTLEPATKHRGEGGGFVLEGECVR